MASVVFLPYVSKAASWCKDRLVGRWTLGPRPGLGRQSRGTCYEHSGPRLPSRPLWGRHSQFCQPAPSPGSSTGRTEPTAHRVEFFTLDLNEPLSKERVEAFSDGVYAIVATLLILDIW